MSFNIDKGWLSCRKGIADSKFNGRLRPIPTTTCAAPCLQLTKTDAEPPVGDAETRRDISTAAFDPSESPGEGEALDQKIYNDASRKKQCCAYLFTQSA